MHVPYVQTKISKIASEELNDILGVPVNIGNVDFELFNKLIIKDLYLEDQNGDVLFQAKRLAVGFEFIPLFKGKIRFKTAQLFSFQFNLNRETEQDPLNLQFVIDAFSSKDTLKKESSIDLSIQTLNLRKGTFTYNVKQAPESSEKFDAKHMEFSDIFTKIHLNQLNKEGIKATFERFSVKEKSGLIVKKIGFDVEATNEYAKISKMELSMPGSLLTLEDISIDMVRYDDLKPDIGNSPISAKITQSTLCLKDIRAFIPALANYTDIIFLEGSVTGTPNHFYINNLSVKDTGKFLLLANAELDNTTERGQTFLIGSIKQSFISADRINDIINNFNNKSIDIPTQIKNLGNIGFEGEVAGYLDHLTGYGILDTDAGSLRTDVEIGYNSGHFIKGYIKSDDLNLGRIMGSEDYGITSFGVKIDAKQGVTKKYAGMIDAVIDHIELKQYSYENITFNGHFTENSFNGIFDIDSPDGKLSAQGLFELKGGNSAFNFSAQAEHINLDRLNLIKKYKESDLSFEIDANFTGNNIDNLLGYIHVENIRFSNEKGGYYIDTLNIESSQTELNKKLLTIKSNLLYGTIAGDFSFKDIVPALKETASSYLPALVKTSGRKIKSANKFDLNITLDDTGEFSNIFSLPFILHKQTKVSAAYNHDSQQISMSITSPEFEINKMIFKDCLIQLGNQKEKAKLKIDVTNYKNEKRNKIQANFDIADNNVNLALKWNDKSDLYNGDFNIKTSFFSRPGKFPLRTEIDLLSSETTFKDTVWTISPSQIILDSANVQINNLLVSHDDQYLKIAGKVSQNPSDSLFVNLNKVNISYVFDILNIPVLEFGGIASGYVIANDVYNTRQLSTNLNVKNFTFNQTNIGDLNLLGIWDDEKQGIRMLGDFYKNDSSQMNVDGIIYPVKEELSIRFGAKNVDASFLRKYLNSVTQNLSGEITGDITLYGDFHDVTVVGDAYVKNGSFDVKFLNTRYIFSDNIHLTSDEISIKNITFLDKFGQKAIANGSVKHNFFSDFTFNASIMCNNFLVFNATEQLNNSFYGTAYASGPVIIKGDENLINFDATLRSNDKTKISLNFMSESDIEEYNFINFISPQKTAYNPSESIDKIFSQLTYSPIYYKTDTGTELKFNLQLEVTPSATLELIMDPLTGDKIKGYGDGNIQIQYGTSSPLKLFGKYTIEKGTYNFSFQQTLYRDFTIREGSSISFKGDPYTATLDINAAYGLNANIGDLNESLVIGSARNSIPVNCILEISGDLQRPDIAFDIELPNSGEELERQVKSLISTEDMMNRQIIYLLVLNKFYTQESGVTSTRTNDFFADLAASSLSSQLNSLLGSLSEKVQIGTKFSSNDNNFTDTEMALILSSQLLNNRLIFNGNFGYRDNTITNTNSFIGDFDLEYKLTPSGDIRLKAYNHYNDRYYSLRSAYTTQGIGVLYRKDFNNFRSLFMKKQISSFNTTE